MFASLYKDLARRWNLVHHVKSRESKIFTQYEHELLRMGHAFKFQYNQSTVPDLVAADPDTFHCGYVNQWPDAAHFNMSNVFNSCASLSFISHKSQWMVPQQFQKKYNISVKTVVDLFDMQLNDINPKWKHSNVLLTKYKSFTDSLGQDLPYLIRKETGEQLIIFRDIHNLKPNVQKMEHILNTYKPDVIINEESPHQQNFSDYFELSEEEMAGWESTPNWDDNTKFATRTAMQYAIRSNRDILLCDMNAGLKDYLRTFAEYFDYFQYQMIIELPQNETYFILKSKEFAEKVLSDEELDLDLKMSKKELARQVLRRLLPHQSMYAVYRDEFIAYGIDNCVNAFPQKPKKLLAIMGEAHSDNVVAKLTGQKQIENILHSCTADEVILKINRNAYNNWPKYDKKYLENDLYSLGLENNGPWERSLKHVLGI